MSVPGYKLEETAEVIGEREVRWGRGRAERYAESLNRRRTKTAYGPPLRYEVRPIGWGRYRVVALQNRITPI